MLKKLCVLLVIPISGCADFQRVMNPKGVYLSNVAGRGDLARVRQIVESGTDSREDMGLALLRAVENQKFEVAAYLLEKPVNRNYTELDGTTPVFAATKTNDLRILKLLLEKGASPNCQVHTQHGIITPLVIAAANDRLDTVQLLLEYGAAVTGPAIKAADDYGYLKMSALLKHAAERQTAHFLKETTGGSAPAVESRRRIDPMIPASNDVSDIDTPNYRATPRPNDFALVVGVEEYKGLPAANFAVKDAEAVRRHLLALGIPERNVIWLANENAGRSAFAKYLDEWLPRNVKPDSSVFFYYSGHGAPDPKTGQAFLVPWDGDAMFLQSTAYPVKELYRKLAKLPAKQVLVALDACFSGAGGRSVLARGARPLVTLAEDLTPGEKISVLAAASGGEITGTLDDQKHGMFTYFFLKALSEGKRSSKDVFDYLKPRVQDEARRQNREQTPVLLGNLVGL